MTQDEFQKKYHDWTGNKVEADSEIALINASGGIDGDAAVAKGFDIGQGVRYCLMLKSAAGSTNV